MKYKIQKDVNGRKFVQVRHYTLLLNEEHIEVRVDGDLVKIHEYENLNHKLDALTNVITYYHNSIGEYNPNMPF